MAPWEEWKINCVKCCREGRKMKVRASSEFNNVEFLGEWEAWQESFWESSWNYAQGKWVEELVRGKRIKISGKIILRESLVMRRDDGRFKDGRFKDVNSWKPDGILLFLWCLYSKGEREEKKVRVISSIAPWDNIVGCGVLSLTRRRKHYIIPGGGRWDYLGWRYSCRYKMYN